MMPKEKLDLYCRRLECWKSAFDRCESRDCDPSLHYLSNICFPERPDTTSPCEEHLVANSCCRGAAWMYIEKIPEKNFAMPSEGQAPRRSEKVMKGMHCQAWRRALQRHITPINLIYKLIYICQNSENSKSTFSTKLGGSTPSDGAVRSAASRSKQLSLSWICNVQCAQETQKTNSEPDCKTLPFRFLKWTKRPCKSRQVCQSCQT